MVTELTGEEFEYVTKPNIDLLSIASESKPVTPATPGKPMTPGHPETPLVTADTPGIPQTPATAVEGYHDMEKLETAEQDQVGSKIKINELDSVFHLTIVIPQLTITTTSYLSHIVPIY